MKLLRCYLAFAAILFVGIWFAPHAETAPNLAEAISLAKARKGSGADIQSVGGFVSAAMPSSASGAVISVEGTYSATLVVKVSGNGGSTYYALNASPFNQTSGSSGALSGDGVWTIACAGTNVEVICTAFTSGTATVNIVPYAAGSSSSGSSGSTGGTGGNVNLNQVGGASYALGQTTKSASMPVTIASDQALAVTANAGTNLNTSSLALESGGNLATLAGAVSAGKVQVSNTKPTSTSATHANPSMTTATSTTLLAAGTYNYIEIDNYSGTPVAINLAGSTISSMTVGSGNCEILLPAAVSNVPGSWHSPPNWTPSTAITGYQTSGSTITSVTVTTG